MSEPHSAGWATSKATRAFFISVRFQTYYLTVRYRVAYLAMENKFMKKSFLVVVLFLCGQASFSQNNQPPMEVACASDLHFLYHSSDGSQTYGVDFTTDFGKYLSLNWNFVSNLKFGSDDIKVANGTVGFGVKQRLLFNKRFLVQGKLYPYLGYGETSLPNNDGEESKGKFLYGAAANIQVGFKLFEIKGNPNYLTLGYMITAPEFKTDNMLKGGAWMIGITWNKNWD